MEPGKDDIITVELSNRWEEYLMSLQVGKRPICSLSYDLLSAWIY